MGEFKNLKLQAENGLLTISINRPESLNALNTATLEEIKTAFEEAVDDADIRGIIVTGVGDKAFVAGADINELAELNEVNARKFSERGQEIFASIESCEKPVIAAINGYALGGGCELAMACHIRIASEKAKFGQPEIKLGVIPGYGGTQRLTQLIGKGKALELMMTGEMIGAELAKQLGLVNYVVEPDKLIPFSTELISKILKQAPVALSNIITSVNAVLKKDVDGYQTEANGFGNCCRTQDFKEGTSAFLEKREPEFKGE